jgi:hypothetical protein
MLEELDHLTDELNRLAICTEERAMEIKENWGELCRIGEKNSHTAAGLLMLLKETLDEIAGYAGTSAAQISTMNADPFCRNIRPAHEIFGCGCEIWSFSDGAEVVRECSEADRYIAFDGNQRLESTEQGMAGRWRSFDAALAALRKNGIAS